MKYILVALVALVGCTPMNNPKCYQVLESISMYPSDGHIDAIISHYVNDDGDLDAYGHILIDGSFVDDTVEFEFGVDVFKNQYGLYIHEWSPVDGHEWKRYLTREQKKWVIKLH